MNQINNKVLRTFCNRYLDNNKILLIISVNLSMSLYDINLQNILIEISFFINSKKLMSPIEWLRIQNKQDMGVWIFVPFPRVHLILWLLVDDLTPKGFVGKEKLISSDFTYLYFRFIIPYTIYGQVAGFFIVNTMCAYL